MVTRVKNTPIGVVYEDGEIVGLNAGKRDLPVVTYTTNPDGGIVFPFVNVSAGQQVSAQKNRQLLQHALDTSSDVRIYGSQGDVWIDDTLYIRSNTRFEVGMGTRLKMIGGVNRSVIRNHGTRQTPVAVDLSYTAGRIATVNWTSHGCSVGDAIVIQGATGDVLWNNVFRVSKIISVDAVEISLHDFPKAPPAGSPVVYVCDKNIRVDANVDYNVQENPSAPQTPHRMATVWNFIADSQIRVNGINTLKYISQIGGAVNVDFRCEGQSGSDMHKVYGPSRDVRSVVQGSSHDDVATFQCKEPPTYIAYQLSVGPISECSFRDLSVFQTTGNTSASVVVYGDDEYRHDNIVIQGPGTVISNERHAVAIRNGGAFSSSNGRIGKVIVRDLALGSKAGHYVFNVAASVEHLVIDSVEMLQSDVATQWFRQESTSSIRILEFRNLNLQTALLNATTIIFNLNGAVDLCVFKNCRVVAEPSPNNKARLLNVGTNGVRQVIFDGGYYEHLDAICTVAASNTVQTEFDFSGGVTFKNCANGVTGLSSFSVKLGSATFDTFTSGVVRPQNAGVVANVYGTGQTTFVSATPITCISGGTAIPRGDVPVDIGATGITKAAGASCFNTGTSRGTIPQNRPVVCDGTNWLNATNLSQTF